MDFIFYFLSIISILFTLLAIFNSNPIYSLLYLILSFISISGILFIFGAFFAAVLEIILYAGAIMVLFVFVVMILNLGNKTVNMEKTWFLYPSLIIPIFCSFMFFLLIFFCFKNSFCKNIITLMIDVKDVGFHLFNNYPILIELISMILLASLIIVLHIGKNSK